MGIHEGNVPCDRPSYQLQCSHMINTTKYSEQVNAWISIVWRIEPRNILKNDMQVCLVRTSKILRYETIMSAKIPGDKAVQFRRVFRSSSIAVRGERQTRTLQVSVRQSRVVGGRETGAKTSSSALSAAELATHGD